jgi:hypothetical protein
MNIKIAMGGFAIAVLGVATLVAPAAQASPTAENQAKSNVNCWYNVSTHEGACFSTFREVVADITDGRVQFAGVPSAMTDAVAAEIADGPVPAAAPYVLVTVWDDANYQPASTMYTASSGCGTDSGWDWELGNLGTSWNDRISSFKSFSDCSTKLYEDADYGGSTYGYYVNSSYVGAAMNDRASSIRWR